MIHFILGNIFAKLKNNFEESFDNLLFILMKEVIKLVFFGIRILLILIMRLN